MQPEQQTFTSTSLPAQQIPVVTPVLSAQQSLYKALSNMNNYPEGSKYSGENDGSFAFKLTIFHDICGRAGVPQSVKLQALPTMLKGAALTYYYSKINTDSTINFDQACNSIARNFEGPEYRRGVLQKWNSTTLRSVIAENSGKSMEECFRLLVEKLRHLQHGLDAELRNERFIHNQLILACQEVPACSFACCKPSDNLADLINNLRSLIITYLHSHPHETESYLTNPTGATTTESYFTDRRYRTNWQRYLEPPPLPRPPTSRDHERSPPPRDQENSDELVKPYGRGWKKKCFVCNRKECWSTNHTREERDAVRAPLRQRYYNRFRPGECDRSDRQFDQRVSQYMVDYIADYEGMDPKVDELVDEMGAFTIEVDSSLKPITSTAASYLTASYNTTSSSADEWRYTGSEALDIEEYLFY